MGRLENDPYIGTTKEKLARLGIKGVLYDLDDTLIYTSEIFRECMHSYADEVASQTGIERDLFYQSLSDINDEEYKRMGVNPLRWRAVVVKLEELFEDKTGIISEKIEVLLRIYSTLPRMRPGALTTMGVMKDADVKQGLVTHANVDWTNWKLDQLGLWNWFEAVYIADENGHKTASHWKSAMDMLGLQPSECLVVGDNLNGDVVPAAGLGAKTVWMPSPWSVYRVGVVPEGTVQISEFNEFLEALDRLT